MATQLTSETKAALTALLAEYAPAPSATTTPSRPGTVVGITNKDGVVFVGAAGVDSMDNNTPMKEDSVFWIASCTKMITGIAAMQLVEQGKLKLDDPVGKLIPELEDPDILVGGNAKDGFQYKKASTKITMRHLMTHTAGFSYSWYNALLKEWCDAQGKNEFCGEKLVWPLSHEPGTQYDYGINMDWAGHVIDKITGVSLGDYCQKNIFDPLGLKDITFDLASQPDLNKRLVKMHGGDLASTKYWESEHLEFSRNNQAHSGGAGVFSTASDYLQIIAALLNNGVGPNGTRILKSETVESMFEDQLEHLRPQKVMEATFPSTDTSLAGDTLTLGTAEDPKGWGLSFMLDLKGQAQWGGIANLFWHLDRKRGIGSMILNNILPYGDAAFYKLEDDVLDTINKEGALVA
ncbi:hypothetical protein MNV49_005664 [Pseudohyphozyma bogoriensis]|nr:hypothetical protein MNV49_005664 [Pseudohyphozyma bogoriensis]